MKQREWEEVPDLRKIRVSIAVGRATNYVKFCAIALLLLWLTMVASLLTYFVTFIQIYLIYSVFLGVLLVGSLFSMLYKDNLNKQEIQKIIEES